MARTENWERLGTMRAMQPPDNPTSPSPAAPADAMQTLMEERDRYKAALETLSSGRLCPRDSLVEEVMAIHLFAQRTLAGFRSAAPAAPAPSLADAARALLECVEGWHVPRRWGAEIGALRSALSAESERRTKLQAEFSDLATLFGRLSDAALAQPMPVRAALDPPFRACAQRLASITRLTFDVPETSR